MTYRIRRGTDLAWLARHADLFWTDIQEAALGFETLDHADLIAANLHHAKSAIEEAAPSP